MAFRKAAEDGKLDTLRQMLADDVDVNHKDKVGALHLAAKGGHTECVGVILGAGVSVESKDSKGKTTLHYAAEGGQSNCMQYLLSVGASKDSKSRYGWTALHYASYGGHNGCVKLILAMGVDVNTRDMFGVGALHLAAKGGHTKCVGVILGAGVSVESKDSKGKTTLHYAAEGGQSNCMQYLLAVGASKDSKSRYGWTALHYASFGGHDGCVELILAMGVDVNTKDRFGRTALHHACFGKHDECLKLLLRAGVDVKSKDSIGNTALQFAARARHIWCLELLLASGVNVNITDRYGNTALHLAISGQHTDCVETLLNGGAQPDTVAMAWANDLRNEIKKSKILKLLTGATQSVDKRAGESTASKKQKQHAETHRGAAQSESGYSMGMSTDIRAVRKAISTSAQHLGARPKEQMPTVQPEARSHLVKAEDNRVQVATVPPSDRHLTAEPREQKRSDPTDAESYRDATCPRQPVAGPGEQWPTIPSPSQEIPSIAMGENARLKLQDISLNEDQHVVTPLTHKPESGNSMGMSKDIRAVRKAISPSAQHFGARPKEQRPAVQLEAQSHLVKTEDSKVQVATLSPSDRHFRAGPQEQKQSDPTDAEVGLVGDEAAHIPVDDSMSVVKLADAADDEPVLPIKIEPLNIKELKINRNNRLGKGNFGFVYKAELLMSTVAVKELGIPKKKKSQIDKSVINEVEVSATVRHPNIVKFMGHCFERQTDCYYLLLVYEFVDGRNLDQIIGDDELAGPFNFKMPTRYQALLQTMQALAYLHTHRPQIIHGDIKPANIMLTKQGEVKLCDLGLSVIKQQSAMSMASTMVPRGTPVYMAPEQLIHRRTTSTMTDIYAFGATMYETLFEKYMWDIADDWDVQQLQIKMKIEQIPSTLQNIQDHSAYPVITKCVQFEPTERPTSLSLVKDLKDLYKNSC